MASDKTIDERIDHLKELYEKRQLEFEKIKSNAEVDVDIDEFNIMEETRRTPKLHQKYLVLCASEAENLLDVNRVCKAIYLERWKYWSGKQTSKYYAKYGPVHEQILKGDLDKYIDQDEIVHQSRKLLELNKQVVDFLEKTTKEIMNRNWLIKNMIEWAKFEAGG